MTEEVDFIAGCPVAGCPNAKNSYTWIHSGCGGTEKLTRKGYLRCVKCGVSGPIVGWYFNCGAHGYMQGSLQGLLNAFSIMGGLNGISMDFLLELMDAVRRQYS